MLCDIFIPPVISMSSPDILNQAEQQGQAGYQQRLDIHPKNTDFIMLIQLL